MLSSGITYLYCKKSSKQTAGNSLYESESVKGAVSNDFNVYRMNSYEYIRPVIAIEKKEEADSLLGLKSKIVNYIEEKKKAGILISASVYLRVFHKGEWISVNDTETYYPGSLIKVAGLLTYLRMEELHPGTLDKRLSFESQKEIIPNQTYNSKQLEFGKSYSVRELLKYMIAYSDNNATYLLNKNVDMNLFLKLYSDLKLTPLDLKHKDVKMNIRDYSTFFKVIYNSTYLSLDHSEFAAELLSQCDFKEGMLKGLPKGTKIAHKFGEMGDPTSRQLHEAGIIYLKDTPYLLTVMTKGYDITKMPSVISDITQMTYDELSKNTSIVE